MTPTIRLLDARTDKPALTDLFDRAADYVLLETGLPPDPQTVEAVFAEAPPGLDKGAVLALGLFRDAQLVGVSSLAFGWPEPTDAYLGLMLLVPGARGQGLGPMFLKGCMDCARARSATRLLLAVLEENPRARAFWHRMGFVHLLTAPPAQIGARSHIRHRLGRAL